VRYLEYNACYLEYNACYLEYIARYLEYNARYLEYNVRYLEYNARYLEYIACYLEYIVLLPRVNRAFTSSKSSTNSSGQRISGDLHGLGRGGIKIQSIHSIC
jgi:hypothetical protein